MPKATNKTSQKATGDAAAKKSAGKHRSAGQRTPLALAGAGVALCIAVAVGFLLLRSNDQQVTVTFRNPSAAEVHVFLDGERPQWVATLPVQGSASRQAAAGQRFFFSREAAGTTRAHIWEVDGNLAEVSYNANCKDLHDVAGCQRFAGFGSCSQNPGWMSVNCAATCNMCHLMDPKVRCNFQRLGMNDSLAVGSGDIRKMFESLPQRFPDYGVKLLSVEPDGPYVATFDSFVTAEESRIVRQLTANKLARSTDQGEIDPATGVQKKITSSGRTSTNSWCDESSGCAQHPVVQKLMQRIVEVVQVPQGNFEYMQVLQYEQGQFYNQHHDAGENDFKIPSGPRLYTMFLYFEEVEEGGGTSFPKLNITVQPAKGKALLWPSCLNDEPYKIDPRTVHAALPVVKGVKLAANVWVRQRNYRVPNLWGCTGSFGEL